jgi:hypothetical protein
VAIGVDPHNAKSRSGIALTKGMVQALASPRQAQSLQFIIGHEMAHLAHKHPTVEASQKDRLAREIQADSFSINYMRHKGISDANILLSITPVMNLLQKNGPPKDQIQLRYDLVYSSLAPADEGQQEYAEKKKAHAER